MIKAIKIFIEDVIEERQYIFIESAKLKELEKDKGFLGELIKNFERTSIGKGRSY